MSAAAERLAAALRDLGRAYAKLGQDIGAWLMAGSRSATLVGVVLAVALLAGIAAEVIAEISGRSCPRHAESEGA